MGIVTLDAAITMAIQLKDNNVFWILTGRTTAWDNEEAPPIEVSTSHDINEIIGAQKCTEVSLCYLDNINGTISHMRNNTTLKYSLVTPENAYNYESKYLYCTTTLKYDEYPLASFRQTALYINTVPMPGCELYTRLIASMEEIQNTGIMLQYENHTKVRRDARAKTLLEVLYEISPDTAI